MQRRVRENLELSVSESIDALADEFERDFRSNQSPQIEEFLSRVDEHARPAALRELLTVEVELRRARQESPRSDDYLVRFFGREAIVRQVLSQYSAPTISARDVESDAVQDDDTLVRQVSAPGAGRLDVRCPVCHAPTNVATDAALTDIACSSCGGQFSLVDSNAALRQAAPLAHLGRFELFARVGMGAFGSVWKARDKQLDRMVAIKIPRASAMSGAEQEQFFREARTAAQLRHPNIVSVHEVGRDGDSIYIVSDFVPGVTLGEWLLGQLLTGREAAELCAKIATALHYAHEQGVVHRDVKPANIMIDADGGPHLMDFGLARREVGEITVTTDGQVLGSPAYMSPEQAQGDSHAADRRSDVYSLGVVLFQLLTGELPFRGNLRMVLHQVINDEPPSPRMLNANVAKDLETITLKCLEKEPAKRYPKASDVADELHRFLSEMPIRARPISRIERVWRWAKANRRIALLLTVVGVLLAAIAIGSSVAAVRISIARNEARAKAAEAQAATKQVNEEARRATGEAEKARQISAFLAGMFQESAPFSVAGLRFGMPELDTHGASLTAREVLERGAQRVDSELQSQPLVCAALKDVVGNVYLGLGMIERAEPLLSQSLALRREQLPVEHLDIAASLHSLGMLRLAQGRYADSADAVREAFDMRRSLLGDDSELVEISRRALVTILTFYQPGGREDTTEALELSQESVAWSRGHLGDSHPETAVSMLISSGCLLNKDRHIEAGLLIAKAQPILAQHESTASLGKAISNFQQAVIWSRLGWRNQAIAATESGLELAGNSVDNRHPLMTIARRTALGILLYNQEVEKAQQLCEDNLSQLDGNSPGFDVCEAKGELALVFVTKGDQESVLEACELAIEVASMLVDIKHPPPREFEQLIVRIAEEAAPFNADRAAALWQASLPLAMSSIARNRSAVLRDDSNQGFLLEVVLNYGTLLQSMGRRQEAVALFSETMPVARKAGDHYTLMRLSHASAMLNWNDGHAERADQSFRESLQCAVSFRQRNSRDGAAWAGEIMSQYGRFLASQERFQEAERLRRESLQTLLQCGRFAHCLHTAIDLGPDDVDEVIKAAQSHRGDLEMQPLDLLVAGELRLIAGNRLSSEAAIRAATKGGDVKHYFHKDLGWCLLSQQRPREAKHAFQEALKALRRDDGTYDLARADPDQMTAAYFLDLVPEREYIERYVGDAQLACYPWFYVAQRRDIEGDLSKAVEAYERCVLLGRGRSAHVVQALAQWRLRKLKKTAHP